MAIDSTWCKVWRDLWQHKSRSLLVVLAMAISLTGAGALLNTWALVREATRQGFEASQPVSATLRVDGLSKDVLASLQQFPELAAWRLRRVQRARIQVDGKVLPADLFAYDDFRQSGIGRLQPLRGDWPPPASSLIIEASAIELSGLTPGTTATLVREGQTPVLLPVRGVARDVALAPAWMEHRIYAFVSLPTLAELDRDARFDELQVRVADASLNRADVRRLVQRLRLALETAGARVRQIDVPEPGQHVHAAQMDSMLLTQGAFAVLTVLVALLLIVNLVSALMVTQRREIAIMKTLGGGEGRVAVIYLAHMAALGMLAALIASPLALGLGWRYADIRVGMLNFTLDGIQSPLWLVPALLGLGVVLPMLAATWPIRRGLRLSIAQGLNDRGLCLDSLSTWPQRLSARWRLLTLALGNALRQRARLLLNLLALCLGGAVFMAALNLRAAVRDSVDLLFASQRYDVSLRLAERAEADKVLAEVNAVPGVARAEVWGGGGVEWLDAEGLTQANLSMLALPTDSRLFAPRLREGRWLRADDAQAVVISDAFRRTDPTLAPGSEIRFAIADRTTTWRVVGIIAGGPQPTAYVSDAAWQARTGRRGLTSVVLAADADSAFLKLETITRVRTELGIAGFVVAASSVPDESRRVIEDHLLMVVRFLGAMGWVMIVIGGIGLTSTLSLAVLERRREIGVLRAIGGGHGAIALSLLLEAEFVALLAFASALPLSMPMTWILGEAFGRIMFSVPLYLLPQWQAVIVWLILSILVAGVAALWPAWRALRLPVADALQYQ